ncbi:MAG: DedA family protein [Armatimonadota bacterium]
MELLERLVTIVLHLDQYLDAVIQTYGVWAYLILFLIVFCETGLVITPFLPGDSLLFVAGALAARGSLDVWWLAGSLAVAAVAGDAVNYWVGSSLGARLLRQGEVRYLKKDYLDRTHQFYEKYGAKTIVLARFVPIIRTFAPFVAGLGRMTYRRFAVYNVAGGLAWIAIFVFGGYFFGNVPAVKRHFTLVILAVIVLSVLPIAVSFLRERSRSA